MAKDQNQVIDLTSAEMVAMAKLLDEFDGDLIGAGLSLRVEVFNFNGEKIGMIKFRDEDGYYFYPEKRLR